MQKGFPKHFDTAPMRGAIEHIFTEIHKPTTIIGEILAKINPDGFTVKQLGRVSGARDYVRHDVDGKRVEDVGISYKPIMRYSRKATNEKCSVQVSVARDYDYSNGYDRRLLNDYSIRVTFVDLALLGVLDHEQGLEYKIVFDGGYVAYDESVNGDFDTFAKTELVKAFHANDAEHMKELAEFTEKMQQVQSIISKYL